MNNEFFSITVFFLNFINNNLLIVIIFFLCFFNNIFNLSSIQVRQNYFLNPLLYFIYSKIKKFAKILKYQSDIQILIFCYYNPYSIILIYYLIPYIFQLFHLILLFNIYKYYEYPILTLTLLSFIIYQLIRLC